MFLAPTLFLEPGDRRAKGAVVETVVLNLLVAAGYVLTGYAGLRLAFVGDTVTLFWAPSGIAFAAIWLRGARLAPGVAAGAFIVNVFTGLPVAPTMVVACGNTLAALMAVTLLRRAVVRNPGPGEVRRVLWFVLVAVLGATLISATIGTIAVHVFTELDGVKRWTWPVWWLGDAMGALIAAPPILLWRRFVAARTRPRDLVHAAGFVVVGVALVAIQTPGDQPIWAMELLKLLMLMLSLAAGARFGLAGPAMITLVVAIGSVLITAFGTGPFVQGDFYDRLAEAHAFLFTTAAAGMLLAAVVADLHRAIWREREAQAAVEAASASRVRMLTLISHDLRTPLGAMTTALGTLRRPIDDDDRERLIEAGLHAGDMVATLVDDILATASLDRGQITLEPAPFDLRQSLAHVTQRHQARADAKQLTLTLEVASSVPTTLCGDRVRIEQIVDNLVGNAVAFTQQGNVTVQCGWTGELELSVTDTGEGIAPAMAAVIFDAFVKADPGLRSGLGLGLHIARGLAALMGGTLAYHPALPRGSCFVATLPLRTAEPEQPVRAPGRQTDALDILLIEDDPISREITAAWLMSQDHHVATVGDGEQALALAREKRFDLVLVDNDLGEGMSGEAVTIALRALPLPVAHVPIVALTGSTDEYAVAALQKAGVDSVIQKPIPLTTDITSFAGGRDLAASLLEIKHPGFADER